MPKFNPYKFKVNEEPKKIDGVNIVKADKVTQPVIKDFEMSSVKKSGPNDYSAIKAKYGPLAPTDPERGARAQKDRRFLLNPLLRDPLSIEQEELRAIEERVHSQVVKMAENAKAAAIEEGYQEGLKKGYEEAFKQFRAESAELIKNLDQLVNEVENVKYEMFQANERFLIELVFKIAKSILLKELSTDKDYVLRLAKELLARVGVRDYLHLRLSPEDSEMIDSLKTGIEKTYGTLKNLNIEVSNDVKKGSCSIETEWNTIDTDIEKQLTGVHDALVGGQT